MASPASPRAAFFDFGGTLFSYRTVQGRAFYPILIEALERLGVEIEPRQAGRLYREASASVYGDFHSRDYYLHRDLYVETFRRFAEGLGAKAADPHLDWFHEAQRAMVYDGFELRDDCVETLAALRARGLHVGIVSNIDDDYLHPMVEKSGLDAHLDAWTSSEEARSCKPHRGIFDVSMTKAGVEASEAVFVGDSREADIVGARRLGMRTVLIEDAQAPPLGSGAVSGSSIPEAEPHHRITALSELLDLVAD